MKASMRFYFDKIEFIGMEKIPRDKPCLFSPNHQNAFIDALLIGGSAPIKISYLTRSDVFDTPLRWFLDALQMLPIYRIRDGYEKLSLNDAIFETCRDHFRKGKSILMFSEGNHGKEYFLRPLSKGSSRLALESQEQVSEQEIFMIPVGVNYYHHRKPGFKLSMVFGDPISMKDYMEEYHDYKAKAINRLKKDLSEGMKECMILPENDESYEEKKQLINKDNEHLSFHEFRKAIQQPGKLKERKPYKPGLMRLADIISAVNFLPLLVIRKVLMPVKDIVFICSLKYAIGMFLLPVWWLFLYGVTSWVWNGQVGLAVFLIGFLTSMLRITLIRNANPPH